jgi:hypothetical protein
MRDKFVFSLISAVGIFCLGSGVSVWHGVSGLMAAEPVEHIAWSAAGLFIPPWRGTLISAFLAVILIHAPLAVHPECPEQSTSAHQ